MQFSGNVYSVVKEGFVLLKKIVLGNGQKDTNLYACDIPTYHYTSRHFLFKGVTFILIHLLSDKYFSDIRIRTQDHRRESVMSQKLNLIEKAKVN